MCCVMLPSPNKPHKNKAEWNDKGNREFEKQIWRRDRNIEESQTEMKVELENAVAQLENTRRKVIHMEWFKWKIEYWRWRN